MKVKVNPKTTNLNAAVTLTLSVDEALALESLLGVLSGRAARRVPWYDQIADELEAKLPIGTISQAVEGYERRLAQNGESGGRISALNGW